MVCYATGGTTGNYPKRVIRVDSKCTHYPVGSIVMMNDKGQWCVEILAPNYEPIY
jgi:hypothetical protein